jgi:hypothetical protein
MASTSFYLLGLAAAGTWIVGSLVSGHVPIGTGPASCVGIAIPAAALSLIAFLGFLGADLVGQHLPIIRTALHHVLAEADAGPTALVLVVALVNGLGEERFSRRWDLTGREPCRP